jgi:lysyl-tRNA synthetase class 2
LSINWSLARKRARLEERARILQLIRNYFHNEGYLETDTPLLLSAVAPEAYINPVPVGQFFLQTSPELCMKRLLAAGYERVFQLCHCWRADERGSRHLPEFTMLEWYRTGAGYHDLMTETRELILAIASGTNSSGVISFQGGEIDLGGEWQRISVSEAFRRYAGTSVEQALAEDDFDRIMVELIEPQLGRQVPVFLYDYPAQRSALARLKPDDNSVAERFELYIAGVELANGFTELTDPEEQRRRFLQEIAERAAAGQITIPLPETFLRELAHMPPAAGIALGVERLIMLFTDATSIDEVVAFTPEEL